MAAVALSAPWMAFAGPAVITGSELVAAMQRADAPLLLDARTPTERTEGVMAGAITVGPDPVRFVADDQGGAAVVVLPRHAPPGAAEEWMGRLAALGITGRILDGGFAAWLAAGGELVTPIAQPAGPLSIPLGLCDGS